MTRPDSSQSPSYESRQQQVVYDRSGICDGRSRQLANRFLWLGGLVLYLTVQDFSWTHLKQVGGGRVPIYLATFILALAFYW